MSSRGLSQIIESDVIGSHDSWKSRFFCWHIGLSKQRHGELSIRAKTCYEYQGVNNVEPSLISFIPTVWDTSDSIIRKSPLDDIRGFFFGAARLGSTIIVTRATPKKPPPGLFLWSETVVFFGPPLYFKRKKGFSVFFLPKNLKKKISETKIRL